MVDLQLKFNKYDYFGIIIPGILFIFSIIVLVPFDIYLGLEIFFVSLSSLQSVYIFLISMALIVFAYVIGFVISGIGRWIIEEKIIGKKLKYPSENLFSTDETTKKFFFQKYKKPYSKQFIGELIKSFNQYFKKIDFSEDDGFKLCFSVVKENCPVAFGRLTTFLSLYGLYRTLCIEFVLILIIFSIYSIFYVNALIVIILIFLPMLSVICFSNYLKFYKTYADEVFRSVYIYFLENKKNNDG